MTEEKVLARSDTFQACLEVGARVEAEWDGRDFDALGRADKARYVDRFDAAMEAYHKALFEFVQIPKPPVGA